MGQLVIISRMKKIPWHWLILLCLAFWLRLPGLFANTFHADEALFASWARAIASWQDPLLANQAIDKPPLLFYSQALFYALLGPVEWAARLPNFAVSLLMLPLTAVAARRLYPHLPRQTGWLAALFLACSPLAVQFSPTAFTDPFLLFWLLAAIVTLLPHGRRPAPLAWSGFFFALAVGSKYQAMLFVPLLLLLAWGSKHSIGQLRPWLRGCLPPLLLLLAWEIARNGRFDLWTAQMSNYGGVRLIWSWEWGARGQAWLRLASTAVPLAGAWGLLLLAALWPKPLPRSLTSWGLALFCLAYLGLHWLVAVPIWDRYLLLLLPWLALLLADGWQRLTAVVPPFGRLVLAMLLAGQLLSSGWEARNGRYAVGGSRSADQGAAELAAYLADAPYGTVLYDHWFSWQWRYHFFYKGVYVSWFPHADALVEDLAVFGRDGHGRYLALPNQAAALPIQRQVEAAGFALQPVAAAGNITLYKLEAETDP